MARLQRVTLALTTCLIPALLSPADVQKIEISVERKNGEKIARMNPSHVFEEGDLVRFRFTPNFPGYLYVTNQSTSGKYVALFPNKDTGTDNRVEANHSYLVPASESGWFRIEGPPGHEILYWIVSPANMDPAKAGGDGSFPTPPSPAPTRPLAPILPRCDDEMFRARGECLDVTAGPKAIQDPAQIPRELRDLADPHPRDMSVNKSGDKASVTVPAGLHAPFIYSFRLAHK